jgi:DNA excision repair protein ERCC-5
VEAKRPEDQDVIDLQAETAHKEIPVSMTISDNAANAQNEAQDADDRLLQQAIKESIENAKQTASKDAPNRYLQYAPPDRELSVDVGAIVDEQRELKKLRNRQMRDTEGVNDEMVQDVMELLQLFGVPYLVCPMEAEAQCAALEQLGLVDGIITDDSDIFPFGGKKVYKNIFHNQKFVEAFFADDVKKELGFSQDEMIALAMLLGSDYTDGVRGIGIVNASEVVAAYPGVDGLKEFKQWVQTFDVAEEARRRVEKKKTQAEIDAMSPQERFEYTHASVRRKWELGDEFPNPRVVQAYKAPEVDRTDSRFSWELPNLAGLRDYCTQTFGWDQSKTDTVLLPLMEQIASSANERHRQTRIDQFFTKYDDNVKYAKIQSKRLRSAVEDKTGVSRSRASAAAPDTSSLPAKTSKMPTKKVQPTRSTKAKFTKTKKTTSTLGL